MCKNPSNLIHTIEQKKKMLDKVLKESNFDFSDQQVISISTELDNLLVRYMKANAIK